jgi:threonine synthase
MLYVSTRGKAPAISFNDALLAGLARDGGLYVPERWPELSRDTIAGFRGKSYAEVAFEVIRPFVAGSFKESELQRMIDEAYATFDHAGVAPLVELGRNE